MGVVAGLDWGAGAHAVCVIDAAGTVTDRFEVTPSREGLAALIARLARHGPPDQTAVAIERPSGLIVDALLDAGFVVTPIHPNLVKACRPRYRAVAAKSDPGDAYSLAAVLRTDGQRLRPLTPPSDDIKALRGLVRGRDDLVATRVARANQLTALLDSFWPGAAAIFADVASPIALAFLARYPTPDAAARLGPKRLAAFLAQHRYSGRRTPEALLARLDAAPQGRAGEAECEANGELVRALARALQTLVGEIAKITSRIEHMVEGLPDGRACPTGASSWPSRAPARSAPPRSWPSSATCASATRPTTSAPPRPASHRLPTPAASRSVSAGAGPSTSSCA